MRVLFGDTPITLTRNEVEWRIRGSVIQRKIGFGVALMLERSSAAALIR